MRVRWHRLRLELVKVGVEQLGQGVIHFADQHVVVEIKVQIDPGLVQLRPEIHRLHSTGTRSSPTLTMLCRIDHQVILRHSGHLNDLSIDSTAAQVEV